MTWVKSQDTAMVPMEKRASAVVGLPPSAVRRLHDDHEDAGRRRQQAERQDGGAGLIQGRRASADGVGGPGASQSHQGQQQKDAGAGVPGHGEAHLPVPGGGGDGHGDRQNRQTQPQGGVQSERTVIQAMDG